MVILGYTECDLVSIVRLLRVRELGVVRTVVCAVELNTTIQRTFSRSSRVCLYQKVSILEFTGAGYNGGSDVMTTGAVTCKAPVKSSPPTNQHPTFYRSQALPVAQPTVLEH